jgi:hypothetical protein
MGMEWVEDVELPKVLGEKRDFDQHTLREEKEVKYQLPSGDKSTFKVVLNEGIKFNLDPICYEITTSNLFINDTSQTTTETTFTWYEDI